MCAPLRSAGLLFQVIADRGEKAAVIVTTNLPFSEWPKVFHSARLCKAMLDRLTDTSYILETGTESFRFRRTIVSRRKNAAPSRARRAFGRAGFRFALNAPLRGRPRATLQPPSKTNKVGARDERYSDPAVRSAT